MLVNKLVCDKCGTINDDDAKYCKECGTGNVVGIEVLHSEYTKKCKKCKKCGRVTRFGHCSVCENIMFFKQHETV